MCVGYLVGVRVSYDRQCYYSPYLVSTETDERGFEYTKSLRIHFQLLEGREVNDICQASVIYQNPSGIESLSYAHNDQRVVIRLLHPFGIFF